MKPRLIKMIILSPLILLAMTLFIALGTAIVLWLWNWLMPVLFGLPLITFWQALGLLVLCRILFGGWGRHGGGHSRWRRRWEERCEHMTPEEKERIRGRLRERFGFDPTSDERR